MSARARRVEDRTVGRVQHASTIPIDPALAPTGEDDLWVPVAVQIVDPHEDRAVGGEPLRHLLEATSLESPVDEGLGIETVAADVVRDDEIGESDASQVADGH